MAWKERGQSGGTAGSVRGASLVVLRVSLGVFMIAKGLDKLDWFLHPDILAGKLTWVAPVGEVGGAGIAAVGRFACLPGCCPNLKGAQPTVSEQSVELQGQP